MARLEQYNFPMIARRLGEFAAALDLAAVPAEVRDRARHLILDAIGCGLAAGRFDFAAPSLRALAGLGGRGERAVVGQAMRLPLRDAVLANGILMHGLDYDDTHTEGVLHLTVAVLPAALGVAAAPRRAREIRDAVLGLEAASARDLEEAVREG
jgi:2-methylcitrate dehydratase PrpD